MGMIIKSSFFWIFCLLEELKASRGRRLWPRKKHPPTLMPVQVMAKPIQSVLISRHTCQLMQVRNFTTVTGKAKSEICQLRWPDQTLPQIHRAPAILVPEVWQSLFQVEPPCLTHEEAHLNPMYWIWLTLPGECSALFKHFTLSSHEERGPAGKQYNHGLVPNKSACEWIIRRVQQQNKSRHWKQMNKMKDKKKSQNRCGLRLYLLSFQYQIQLQYA